MKSNGGSLGNKATTIYASTLGVLVGLAGVEHGIFEVLQGTARPYDLMIDAIGPEQKLWEHAGEAAVTIVPSFLISGILSIVLGILVTIWALKYIDSKHGALVFLVMSGALFMVGGGFAPISLTILAFAAATRIDKPLIFWRSRAPSSVRNLMAKLWPWTLIISVVVFVIAVETAIFGEPLLGLAGADMAYSIQVALGFATLVLAIISFPAANAHDAQSLTDLGI